MTPEEAAYVVLRDCDRRDPAVKRIMDANDRELSEQHAQLLRDDPDYAQQWNEGMRQFVERMDEEIARKVYGDMFGQKGDA